MQRKSLSNISRLKVAASQNWKCYLCSHLLSAHFQIDHKVALCNGEQMKIDINVMNSFENLGAICAECHSSKTYMDRFPSEYERITGRSKYFQGGPLDTANLMTSMSKSSNHAKNSPP
jgi:hypothetical protein